MQVFSLVLLQKSDATRCGHIDQTLGGFRYQLLLQPSDQFGQSGRVDVPVSVAAAPGAPAYCTADFIFNERFGPFQVLPARDLCEPDSALSAAVLRARIKEGRF